MSRTKVPCPRCQGRGGWPSRRNGGTCFRCHGARYISGPVRPGWDLALFAGVLVALTVAAVYAR